MPVSAEARAVRGLWRDHGANVSHVALGGHTPAVELFEPPVQPPAGQRVRLTLPPNAHAASIARQFVEDHRDHVDADVVEETKLLVSEIVTNAVRYGRPEIVLWLRVCAPSIGVEVADAGEIMPTTEVSAPPVDQPSGRGLMIVDTLASEWGVSPHGSAGGKTVWFSVKP